MLSQQHIGKLFRLHLIDLMLFRQDQLQKSCSITSLSSLRFVSCSSFVGSGAGGSAAAGPDASYIIAVCAAVGTYSAAFRDVAAFTALCAAFSMLACFAVIVLVIVLVDHVSVRRTHAVYQLEYMDCVSAVVFQRIAAVHAACYIRKFFFSGIVQLCTHAFCKPAHCSLCIIGLVLCFRIEQCIVRGVAAAADLQLLQQFIDRDHRYLREVFFQNIGISERCHDYFRSAREIPTDQGSCQM